MVLATRFRHAYTFNSAGVMNIVFQDSIELLVCSKIVVYGIKVYIISPAKWVNAMAASGTNLGSSPLSV